MVLSYILSTKRNEDGSDKIYNLMIHDHGRWDGVTYSAKTLEEMFSEIKKKTSIQLIPLPRFTTVAAEIVVDGKIIEKASLEDLLKFRNLMKAA